MAVDDPGRAAAADLYLPGAPGGAHVAECDPPANDYECRDERAHERNAERQRGAACETIRTSRGREQAHARAGRSGSRRGGAPGADLALVLHGPEPG